MIEVRERKGEKKKKKFLLMAIRSEDLFSAEWTAFAEVTPICMKIGVEKLFGS